METGEEVRGTMTRLGVTSRYDRLVELSEISFAPAFAKRYAEGLSRGAWSSEIGWSDHEALPTNRNGACVP